MEPAEITLLDQKKFLFNDLDTPVKHHVVKFMQQAIEQVLCSYTMSKEVFAMLDQINPYVIFSRWSNGDKTMIIDESDERISKFLFVSYQKQLGNDPELIKKIIESMTKRNDGTDRLKVV